ncbi:hypothetical protein LMG8520_2675 [Lactococcus lactis subsp. lactis]|uniref:Uncharacterized protein n=2 Tax=Lactococcus lactis TaxID=1358 RepID=A0A2A5S6D4_LACLH|nr:hypothetical protein [Lactococcus lactis]KAA8698951.1 hypothetical protein F4V48_12265 [Lactococcus lactis subsp. hordniae]KSU04970.1 hypothetical protein LMG8520_2675 [Lactococcus lactis subsp. lactis]MCT3135614.1 hypothetical protein [Lactococcus lactis]PCS09056.1 hypothetical protein RU90_GL002425 [Lactococcus lactis subsp. hordniae]
MEIINLLKRKLETKNSGRFEVTINKIEAPDSLFVEYEIKIRDYGEDEGFVSVYKEKYSGSNPDKRALQMVEAIKRKNIKETKNYYLD